MHVFFTSAAANLEVQPTEVPEPQVHTPYLAEGDYETWWHTVDYAISFSSLAVNNANLVPPNMKNSDQSPHKGCPNGLFCSLITYS